MLRRTLIVAITSPRHPRPPTNAIGKPRVLLAAGETDIVNARDQKGSSLTAPRPLPSRSGRATISPSHDAVATNTPPTMDYWVGTAKGGGGREEHARAEDARDEWGRGKDGTADVDRRRRRRRMDNPIVDVMGERRCNNLTAVVSPCTG
jgi:hypothetical protein